MTKPVSLPLDSLHKEMGGHITDFHGFLLPVRFSSITEECQAVRTHAGLFDISHMGRFIVKGSGAVDAVNRLMTSNLSAVSPGKALYGILSNESGGAIDDIMAYRFSDDRVDLVVNASNREEDKSWIANHLPKGVSLEDPSPSHVGFALQGPRSGEILSLVESLAVALPRRGALLLPAPGGDILVSRTGYTGEDGWEFFGPEHQVATVYRKILSAGAPFGLKPCGLGARDLLRLEMGYPLYGQELTVATTPFDAGLGFAVSTKKGDFVGRKFLLDAEGNPLHHEDHRLLVGFSVKGRGIPRTDCIVSSASTGKVTGVVTSGGYSPAAGGGFGLAYVDRSFAEEFSLGAPAHVRIHEQSLPIVFRTRPFIQGGLN